MTIKEAKKVFEDDTELASSKNGIGIKLKRKYIVKANVYCPSCGSHNVLTTSSEFEECPEMNYFCNKCKCSFTAVWEFRMNEEIEKRNTVRAKKMNYCKYCKKPTGSDDPNVLCEFCRENFGHAFYSEL